MAAPRNPVGPKSEKPWRAALQRAVKRHAYGTGGPRQLEVIADAVVSKAAEGDVLAAKEVGDRLDGRPVVGLALEVAVRITRIERTIVDPKVIEGECEVVPTVLITKGKAAEPNGAAREPVVGDGSLHAIRKLSDRR